MQQATVDRVSLSWQDIALPLVLVLTGLVLVGGDWLGMLSLDRIANYWPCGAILVGLASLTRIAPAQTRSETMKHAR